MTCIQRTCPGSRARNAGTKAISQIAPRVFAIGDWTLRERNQRAPSTAGNTGTRKAPIPKACRHKSEITAPTMPIQLRAPRAVVSTEALLNDGSRAEWDASARKSRSAETISRNPTGSWSRRLLVGLKMREKVFMTAYSAPLAPFRPSVTSDRSAPEPIDYAKKPAPPTMEEYAAPYRPSFRAKGRQMHRPDTYVAS